MDLINRKVAIIRLCMAGNTPTSGDIKYIGKGLNKIVEIKHRLENDLYITDFFMPEYIEDKNEYCHYGFLVVDRHNFSLIEEY